MLNASLEFSDLNESDQRAFIGRNATKTYLEAGTQLYKFTDNPLYDGGRITSWWSFVDSIAPVSEQLAAVLQRAGNLGVEPNQFAQARSAVTKQWNSMSGLLITRLTLPVYGFVGRCAGQPMDEQYGSRVVWIGGAWQACIPNLTPAEIVQI